jgi:N-acetylglucosaminyldiphosphoundecaprenol N-acetyl-beta-D-mannosaminyltransferase
VTSLGTGPYELLGVRVHAMTVDELFAAIGYAIAHHERWVIGNHNLHSVHLYHRDAAMRQYCDEADHIFIDGMALVFVGSLLGLPVRREHRSTSADWMMPLLRRATERGWRVFLLGGRPRVAERAAENIRRAVPGVQLAVSHGYFDAAPDSADTRAVLERIRRFQPHLLVVGMGMPRQERWILENRRHLAANAVLNLGAIIDYLADEVPTPPRWMSRVGLEWLARLATEPRRLWGRYLVEPWSVLPFLRADLRRMVMLRSDHVAEARDARSERGRHRTG